MNLRQKTLLIIGGTLVGLIVATAAIVATVMLRSFTELEQQDIRSNTDRAVNALQTSLESLESIVLDYSQWDDSYEFVAGEYDDYRVDNLDDYFHAAFDLDFVIFTDTEGHMVYGYGYDFELGETLELSPEVRNTFGPGSPYLFGPDSGPVSRTGIALLPDGPALFVAGAILPSFPDRELTRGTMITARNFDDEFISELSDRTRLSLSIYPYAGENLPADVQEARRQLSELQTVATPLDSQVVAGYSALNDIFGQPALILRVDKPRVIYQQGLRAMILLIAALVFAGVVLSLVAMILLETSVLKRLAGLSTRVRNITEAGDAGARIPMAKGTDELSNLADDINSMLGALEDNSAELERSNTELEHFAYTASHDLQEPLRKIETFGERLEAKYGAALEGTGALYLERMTSAATRMRTLIQDLLAYSRIQTSDQPFVEVDLNAVASEVVNDLEVAIEQTSGRVEIDDLPTIEADGVQMQLLLQNLIGNALKFRQPDNPVVVKVYGKPSSNGHQQIVVKDNGIGFEQKYAEQIFSVFQRLHGREAFEGTGIGLSIVRKIVERHGGSIRANSEVGVGTDFVITLPTRQVPTPLKRAFAPAQA